MELDEEALEGGNVAGPVARVGATVRKPVTAATPDVHRLLGWLHQHGFEASPRPLGVEPEGRRQILEYVPGTLADRMPLMTDTELRRLGAIIRELHDLLSRFAGGEATWEVPIPPERAELVCHHDLAPWNLVRDGDRWVFIDWDGAGLGTRMEDLGYAAHGFVPLHPGGAPEQDALRLRALADGYGCDPAQRRELPGAIHHRVHGMYALLVEGARTGRQPWARLHAEGHADHWGPAAEYVDRHRHVWLAALTAP